MSESAPVLINIYYSLSLFYSLFYSGGFCDVEQLMEREDGGIAVLTGAKVYHNFYFLSLSYSSHPALFIRW